MRVLPSFTAALLLMSSAALADSPSLAGSLWRCTRDTDRSQFVITFYPGGGVGGGELEKGEVSPYIYDASTTREGEWPGRWTQSKERFSWSFPDQQMEISGSVRSTRRARAGLVGREVVSGITSSISCASLSKLPRLGEGLVIPRNSRFIDLEKGEGELKVPAGISLRPHR
ncbi:hypothetical protein AB4Y85_05230 [Microvirga sp. 2YAF29]|uniref:hypothetical protein n=1 Tax=Microvirga sp. 2YAF29 TaxID=3233031 RepID=UPI003F97F2B9